VLNGARASELRSRQQFGQLGWVGQYPL